MTQKQQTKQKQNRRRATTPVRSHARRGATSALSTGIVVIAGLAAAMHFVNGHDSRGLKAPFASLVPARFATKVVTTARPSADAFGRSGEVKVRFSLPGASLEYPLEVNGDPEGLRYQWVRTGDGVEVDSARTLLGAEVVVPMEPGFYHLALLAGDDRRTVDELTVAVMVPFAHKHGVWLGGYRIGNYRGEQGRGERPPPGFVKVSLSDASLPVTKHLRVADFLTHDGQEQWPRYAALDSRLLDKLELVIAELNGWQHRAVRPSVRVDVHSGFRTPWHNRSVRRAAGDSRHQYGDAADVVIDADGDGRYTARDTYLIEVAVDQVEMRYPELAGGMGIYRGRYNASPYVHIDARGKRARWRG